MTKSLVKKSEEQKIENSELSIIEQVVMQGDLSKLTSQQRVIYYRKVCETSGLNPFTRPFDYIFLNGKLTLYAKKDCTEQLRKLNGISIEGLEEKMVGDIFIVKAKARTRDGRTDESTGAVTIANLKGDSLANAIMKAETKAKRRVTLSISGMGWTDETEIDSIPNAKKIEVDLNTGEINKNNKIVKYEVSKISNEINFEPEKTIYMSFEQSEELKMILDECTEEYKEWIYENLNRKHGTENFQHLDACLFDQLKLAFTKKMESNHKKQMQQLEPELLVAEMK